MGPSPSLLVGLGVVLLLSLLPRPAVSAAALSEGLLAAWVFNRPGLTQYDMVAGFQMVASGAAAASFSGGAPVAIGTGAGGMWTTGATPARLRPSMPFSLVVRATSNGTPATFQDLAALTANPTGGHAAAEFYYFAGGNWHLQWYSNTTDRDITAFSGLDSVRPSVMVATITADGVYVWKDGRAGGSQVAAQQNPAYSGSPVVRAAAFPHAVQYLLIYGRALSQGDAQVLTSDPYAWLPATRPWNIVGIGSTPAGGFSPFLVGPD